MSQFTSVSSHGSSQRRRAVRCRCGFEAPLKTSWTNEDPGRRFYGCALFEQYGEKQCEFYQWYDEQMSPRAKEVILYLMKKVSDLKDSVAKLKTNASQLKTNEFDLKEAKRVQEEMKIKMKMMWGILAISWVMIIVLVFALGATHMIKY